MAGSLKFTQGKNEQGMAHIAVSALMPSKNRKQIYACTSSVGPGAANMVTAAATATANNIPVLLLPGDVFATRQPDPPAANYRRMICRFRLTMLLELSASIGIASAVRNS